jgi:hypothetical protein
MGEYKYSSKARFVSACVHSSISFNVPFKYKGDYLVKDLFVPVCFTGAHRVSIPSLEKFLGDVYLDYVPNWMQKDKLDLERIEDYLLDESVNSRFTGDSSIKVLIRLNTLRGKIKEERVKATKIIEMITTALNAEHIRVQMSYGKLMATGNINCGSFLSSIDSIESRFICDLVSLSCSVKLAFSTLFSETNFLYNPPDNTKATERIIARKQLLDLINTVEDWEYRSYLSSQFELIG